MYEYRRVGEKIFEALQENGGAVDVKDMQVSEQILLKHFKNLEEDIFEFSPAAEFEENADKICKDVLDKYLSTRSAKR